MSLKFEKNQITKKSLDLEKWYKDVILKAELADYAPVKGCMVIRPYGYALWENIKKELDQMFKKEGVENAYFPLFIPYSFLKKEKEHIKGFSPELALVTIGGGEKLSEPLVVRPTSETVMYDMYSRWISSYRDLPVLINQWNNIVRWEKRTYLFLRTTEFLWQEGHTAHQDHDESGKFALKALDWYRNIYEDYLAIYPVIGQKSKKEKFAGALTTWGVEALMPSGKALQAATSHDLGQNFAKAFNISFQNKVGRKDFVWQTSWGLSTRCIGALVMAHGDDQGLILPPKIAFIQAVIVPIRPDENILNFSREIKTGLEQEGIRVKLDIRETKSVGWKFNEWELKGVPLRLEIGEKETAGKIVTIVRRDTGEKLKAKKEKIKIEVRRLLTEIQKNLFEAHKKFVLENTHLVTDYKSFKEIMTSKKGFIKAFWCESEDCEAGIKQETKAATRVLPLTEKKVNGKCIYCSKPSSFHWLFAQAY